MWYFLRLYDQPQALDLPAMLHTRGHDIDPGGADGAVPQNVRQFGDILLDHVEGTGKELAQIMGKDLRRLHPGLFTELFHGRPDSAAVQGPARPGDEHRSAADPPSVGIPQQHLP